MRNQYQNDRGIAISLASIVYRIGTQVRSAQA